MTKLLWRQGFGAGGLLLGLMAGCAAETGETPPETAGALDEPVTRDDAVARALTWVQAQLPYCQAPRNGWDAACHYYCSRVDNAAWNAYRSDCSGLVSYAWGLAAPGLRTWEFAPFDYRASGVIDAASLQAGDALNTDGHIMLFKNWVTPSKRATLIEEYDCGKVAREITADVSVNGSSIYVGYPKGGTYTAIRYTGFGGGSGGGSTQECGVGEDGRLYCTNRSGADLHASPTLGSGVVNHLRTTYSWFDCWDTGDLHAGGNTTWYHTQGDDTASFGYVAAVDLMTTSAFDANPLAKGLVRCGGGSSPPPSSSCSVHSDGKLYCDNASGAAIRSAPYLSSTVVNHMRTTHSWFDCWSPGDLHAGGNTTWYHTVGDDNGSWGYMAAADVMTAGSFDANPTASGLRQCTGVPSASACSVHADGKLYCANAANAAMYASPHSASGVVNYLRTTESWFDCWGTGDQHAGGNTTWYHTLGDDNANWGWVPAVKLETTSAFDANPSAQGLHQCAGAAPTSGCSVASDGRLYCSNGANASIYSAPRNSASVVNHLRTTFSWFDCWKTGDVHAGGNTTWYHTLGDDNGSWGYVPAVKLNTTSAFDANPSAQGLPACGN